jgi:hypothetical protein
MRAGKGVLVMRMQPGQARAVVVLLAVIGLAQIASAAEQSDTPNAASQSATQERPNTHATESIEACMAKWDPGTHMTKEQWRETCQRIKDEREPYVRGR